MQSIRFQPAADQWHRHGPDGLRLDRQVVCDAGPWLVATGESVHASSFSLTVSDLSVWLYLIQEVTSQPLDVSVNVAGGERPHKGVTGGWRNYYWAGRAVVGAVLTVPFQ